MTGKLENKTFLIVAGQPKAGTTSLFDWLAQHPGISPSNIKETRFFMDPDYPLPRSSGYDGSNIGSYAKYFDRLDRDVLMEATPDYLYSNLALDIAKVLPNAKLVVIERDPVDRVKSAYRFFQQYGMVRQETTIEQYLQSMSALKISKSTPVHLRVLDHCRPFYIERAKQVFGSNLLILSFDDLRRDPRSVLHRVCDFVGLEFTPLEGAKLGTSNETRIVRSHALAGAFYRSRSRIVYFLRRVRLHRLIGPLGFASKSIERMLTGNVADKKTTISAPNDVILKYLDQNP